MPRLNLFKGLNSTVDTDDVLKDMSWPDVKKRIAGALGYIKNHPILDATCITLLRQIPILGDFLAECYDRSGSPEEEKIEDIQTFLAKLEKEGEERFKEVSELIQMQGSQILKQIIDDQLKITDLVKKSRDEIIESVRNAFYQSFGLTWVTPNYFEKHKSTDGHFEDWRKGFSFRLEDIRAEKEFRRQSVLSEIEEKLEAHKRLLLVGESGTSKSTLLMEVMCDYYEKGYTVLWKPDTVLWKPGAQLVRFIEDLLLNYGGKVFVAVDNAHDERQATIFYVIDQFEDHKLKENVRFLVAARLPEYDLLIQDKLSLVQEEVCRESIRRLNDPDVRKEFMFKVPYFTRDEIDRFIRRYFPNEVDERINEMADYTLKVTGGHAIMVKFFVLGDSSLRQDVGRKFDEYLKDAGGKTNPVRMQVVLVCSLLDIASLPIWDGMLERMRLLDAAFELNREILYKSNALWKTLHPRWCIELLSFLFETDQQSLVHERKVYLRSALQSIYGLKDEQTTISAIAALCNSICNLQDARMQNIYAQAFSGKPEKATGESKVHSMVPAAVVESIGELPECVSDRKKADTYAYYIGRAYFDLGRFDLARDSCEKAIAIDPMHAGAWANKGIALFSLGFNSQLAWNDPVRVAPLEQALHCFEKSLDIFPEDPRYLLAKADTLRELHRLKEAFELYDRVLEHNPKLALAYYYKARAMCGGTQFLLFGDDKILNLLQQAIMLDPQLKKRAFFDPNLTLMRADTRFWNLVS